MPHSIEINTNLTRKIADLARLELSENEVALFTSQLKDILAYVDQLSVLNTDGIEPLYNPFEGDTPLRDDVAVQAPVDSDGKPRVLDAAPDVLNEGFKVPQIV